MATEAAETEPTETAASQGEEKRSEGEIAQWGPRTFQAHKQEVTGARKLFST